MIAVIDYGVGNLFSLCRSLEAIGQEPVVTGDPALLRQADKLFLPGVGAFADAADKLRQTGLDEVIRQQKAIGRNLNQLTTLTNMGKVKTVYLQELTDAYAQVGSLLSDILKARRWQ